MFRYFISTTATVIILSSVLVAADWTVFRGPNGDGKSPDTALLKEWNESGPKLLWQKDFLGFGYSSVSVAGDRIYTNGNIGDLTMVFCLDKDGNKIWEKDNGPAHTESRRYPGTRSTPTVDGDVVYDASPLGAVTCYNAKTGEKIWSRNLLTEYEAPMPRWFLGHSVTINGENLICMVGGEKALVAVLNKKTGEPVKTFANPSGGPTSYVTPYFFEFEGISVLAVMTDTTACGYDYKTGKLLFSIPWVNQRTTHCTMPIYKDGHLFLSTGYSFGAKGFKLTKNADGTITPEELWYEQRFDNHHGGIILVGDYVYGVTSRGNWCAVNFLTGEVSYLARPVGEDAAISYADGMIYALSYDSRTVVLWEPNPKEFVERGRFTLPHEAEGKSWAHPVVIGGRLYLRHAEHLYCYDIKAK